MKCNPVWLIRYELPFSFLVSSILQSVQCTGYIYMVCLINFAWQRKTYKTNPLLTCQKQQPKPISMAIFHEKQADCPSEKKQNTKAPGWWFDSTAPWSCSAQFPACYMPAKSHLPAGWVFAQKTRSGDCVSGKSEKIRGNLRSSRF